MFSLPPQLIALLYELFMAIGIASALGVFFNLSQRPTSKEGRKIFKSTWIFGLFCFGLLCSALGGAQLLSAWVRMGMGEASPIFFSLDRGVSIVFYGGLAGILAFSALSAFLLKLPLYRLWDVLTIPILIAHFWGRIGCFARGCCYGKICDLPWAVLHPTHHIPAPRHPVQLYEVIWLGALLALFHSRLVNPNKRPDGALPRGRMMAIYLVTYSAGRFVLEFWRDDSARGFLGALSTSQFLAIIFIILGLLLDFHARRIDSSHYENRSREPQRTI